MDIDASVTRLFFLGGVYDATTGHLLADLSAGSLQTTARFSPNGKYLAVAMPEGDDPTITIYATSDWHAVSSGPLPAGVGPLSFKSLLWASDSSELLSMPVASHSAVETPVLAFDADDVSAPLRSISVPAGCFVNSWSSVTDRLALSCRRPADLLPTFKQSGYVATISAQDGGDQRTVGVHPITDDCPLGCGESEFPVFSPDGHHLIVHASTWDPLPDIVDPTTFEDFNPDSWYAMPVTRGLAITQDIDNSPVTFVASGTAGTYWHRLPGEPILHEFIDWETDRWIYGRLSSDPVPASWN